MLLRLWERLRGYDKSLPVVATVQSAELCSVDQMPSDNTKPPVALGTEAVCRIKWHDQNQNEHAGEFRAFEESPLYQLCDGDEVRIRINPSTPSEYYLPGLLRSELDRMWKLTVFTLMMIILCIAFVAFLLLH